MNTATTTTLSLTDLVDAIAYDVPGKYGAPMGRSGSNQLEPDLQYTVVRIPLFDGYDMGGAYWGSGQALYACIAIEDGDEFIAYQRHDSFESFAKYLGDTWNATAIDAGSLPCHVFLVECGECNDSWYSEHWINEPHETDLECQCGCDTPAHYYLDGED